MYYYYYAQMGAEDFTNDIIWCLSMKLEKILKLHFKVNCKPTLLHKDWSYIRKSEGFCQKPGSRILNNCSNEVLLRSTEFIR